MGRLPGVPGLILVSLLLASQTLVWPLVPPKDQRGEGLRLQVALVEMSHVWKSLGISLKCRF